MKFINANDYRFHNGAHKIIFIPSYGCQAGKCLAKQKSEIHASLISSE